jgi:hypothetical protein
LPLDAPRLTRLAAAALVVVASLLGPARARAAACCGTGHGLGQRLGPAERAAATAGVRASDRFGAWTSRRDVVAPADGDHDRELGLEIGWIARAGRRVQIGVAVPILATWKALGGASSSGGGVGDVSATGRLDLLEEGPVPWAPSVTATFTAGLPTGRPSSSSRDPLGADVTGLGAAELRPGLAVEKSWDAGVYATAAASAAFRTTSHAASGAEVHLAPRISLIAAAGPFWDSGLSLSLGVLHEREAAPTVDGRRAPGADRARTALLAFAAYDLTRRWTAVGSFQLDLPIAGLGRNEPAAIAPYAGIRHVWGAHD